MPRPPRWLRRWRRGLNPRLFAVVRQLRVIGHTAKSVDNASASGAVGTSQPLQDSKEFERLG